MRIYLKVRCFSSSPIMKVAQRMVFRLCLFLVGFLLFCPSMLAQTEVDLQSFYSESLQEDLMLEKEILNDYGRYSNEYISITWEIAQDYLGLHDSDSATKYMVTCFLSMIRFYPENDICWTRAQMILIGINSNT